MCNRTKSELEQKVAELEKWLTDNPGHVDSVEVQNDLREANEQLKNWQADEK